MQFLCMEDSSCLVAVARWLEHRQLKSGTPGLVFPMTVGISLSSYHLMFNDVFANETICVVLG